MGSAIRRLNNRGQINNQSIPSTDVIQLTLTLKMTTAQVVETSVTVNNNNPIQDYVHPDDQTQPFEMTPGFKPFTVFQHCWGHAPSLRMVYKDLWVVSFRRCTAGPNIVGSCCIRLHTTANTHATTPNIVEPTMLGVVASVCTQP